MTGSVNWRAQGTFASGDGNSGTTSGIAGGGKLVGVAFNISDTADPGNLTSFTNASWSTSPTWTHFETRTWTNGSVFYSLGWAKAENAYAGNGSIDANWSGTSAVGWAGVLECDSDVAFDIAVMMNTGSGTAVASVMGGTAAAMAAVVAYATTQTTITWNNSYTEVAEIAETVASVGEVGLGTKVQANTDEVSITLGATNPWGLVTIGVFEGAVPPTPQSVVATKDTSGAATTITMPNDIVAGDLLIIHGTNDSPTGADTAISGWDLIKGPNNSGTAIQGNTWAKIAAGGDTASATSGSSGHAVYMAYRIPDATHAVSNVTTDIIESTVATGTSSTPNSTDPSGMDSGKEYLVVNVFHADDDDNALQFSGSGYNGIFQEESAETGTTTCHVGIQTSFVTGVTTTAPPNAALAASEEWVTWTLCIPAAVAVTNAVDLGALTVTPTIGNPTVGGTIQLGALTVTPTIGNPEVDGTIQLGALTVTPTIGDPTVGGTISLGALTVTPTIGDPTVSGVTTNIDLGALTVTPTIGAPTVGGTIFLGELTITPVIGNPEIDGTIQLDALTVTPTIGAPTVGGTIQLGALTITPTIGGPTVIDSAGNIVLGELTVTPTIGAPTVVGTISLGSLIVVPVIGAPNVSGTILLGALTITPTIGNPTVKGTILLGSLIVTPTIAINGISPTTISLGALTVTPTIGAPTLLTAPVGIVMEFGVSPAPTAIIGSSVRKA